MKRFTLLFASLFLAFLSYAVSPIPSYNQQVIGPSTFAEVASKIGVIADERRDLNVESPPNPTENPLAPATVYVFRLDGTKSMGPFFLAQGGFLTVRIDNKPWGVSISSASPMMVSVYITEPMVDYINYNEDQDLWGTSSLV